MLLQLCTSSPHVGVRVGKKELKAGSIAKRVGPRTMCGVLIRAVLKFWRHTNSNSPQHDKSGPHSKEGARSQGLEFARKAE